MDLGSCARTSHTPAPSLEGRFGCCFLPESVGIERGDSDTYFFLKVSKLYKGCCFLSPVQEKYLVYVFLIFDNMNEAGKNISSLLLGQRFKTFVVGRRAYTVYSPSIKVICRAIGEFADIDIPEQGTLADMVRAVPGCSQKILRGIACLVAGNADGWEEVRDRIAGELEEGMPGEINGALNACVSLIQGSDFFACAALAMSVARMAATPR